MGKRIARCVLTIDVEDWFHILDSPATPPLEKWERLPSRVVRNVERMLDILSTYDVRATFFFLGWIAERFPTLVQRVSEAGHEIASHGYAHQLVSDLPVREFAIDIARTKKLLESITGGTIVGYRAPGFSLPQTPAYAEALSAAGYVYDSSLFPGHHNHAGMRRCPLEPHLMSDSDGAPLWEFPVGMIQVLGQRFCMFGGGYLRLAPYALIRRATRHVLHLGRPVIFYVHPREIDPDQPRLPLSVSRRFRTYVNVHTTERKLCRLLSEFEFTTLAQLHRSENGEA